MPAGLAEARRRYDVSVPRTLATLRRGALPAVTPSLRFKLRYKLSDEFEFSPMGLGRQDYVGLALQAATGKVRATLSSLYGLSGQTGHQWAYDSWRPSQPLRHLPRLRPS